jgi:dipeptidyl-peptidase-3
VKLKTYEANAAGVVQSFVDRFPNTDVDTILQQLWDKDRPYF